MQLHQEPTFAPTPRATPSYGEGGWATAVFSTTIAAPPATCLGVVLDPAGYGAWNRWIPSVGIDTPAPASAAAAVPPALAPVMAAKTEAQQHQQQLLLLLPGARFHFDVHMDPDSAAARRTDLEVTRLEAFASDDGRPGLRVAWKTQGDPWHIRAERVQEFVDDGAGGCYYSNYETFYGFMAWVIKTSLVAGPLQNGLGLWMKGLKTEAEAKAKSAS